MKEPRCMVCCAELPPKFAGVGVCENCARKIIFTVERRDQYIEQTATEPRRHSK